MFYLYILRCSDGSFYIGHTDDIEARMRQHDDRARGGYTATRHPLELVHVSEFDTRLEALECERKLKRWSRGKKEAFIRGDWATVHNLARCRSAPPR